MTDLHPGSTGRTEEAATRTSYDKLADEYARRIGSELADKPLDRGLLDAFAEMVKGCGTVADIGCGPGHVGRYLFDQGVPAIGIDLSPGMIEVARSLNPGMSFQAGSMLDLPISDQSLAGIVAFYSIVHLSLRDLPKVFAEFFRTLAPGGLLMVAFHLGDTTVHNQELWGFEIDLQTSHFEREVVGQMMVRSGFESRAQLEREPDPAVEYPSRRAYLLARRPKPAPG